MLPRHWLAAEDTRAAFARTLDAVNALDARRRMVGSGDDEAGMEDGP